MKIILLNDGHRSYLEEIRDHFIHDHADIVIAEFVPASNQRILETAPFSLAYTLNPDISRSIHDRFRMDTYPNPEVEHFRISGEALFCYKFRMNGTDCKNAIEPPVSHPDYSLRVSDHLAAAP